MLILWSWLSHSSFQLSSSLQRLCSILTSRWLLNQPPPSKTHEEYRTSAPSSNVNFLYRMIYSEKPITPFNNAPVLALLLLMYYYHHRHHTSSLFESRAHRNNVNNWILDQLLDNETAWHCKRFTLSVKIYLKLDKCGFIVLLVDVLLIKPHLSRLR